MKSANNPVNIVVCFCAGTCGVAAGGMEVLESFKNALEDAGKTAHLENRCRKVGCRGFCAKDVLVDIDIDGHVSTYQFVTPEKVPRIVTEHVMGGTPVAEWLVGEDYEKFHRLQKKLLLGHLGKVDPESIEEYIQLGGYEAARKALTMEPGEIVSMIKKSGLRGRGGGGFPTGVKWESCRNAKGRVKYVLCNADEGDPGAFMDRSIIEGNAHAVIEGMIIGAYAIGASEGYVYIRAEYPLAVERLRLALNDAREKGYLGKSILGQDFDFDIQIFLGAGAFVCGESTALMTSIEDKAGEPRPKYVHTTDRGLHGAPSNLNNVETWATIPIIINKGAEWFAAIGSEKSKGTKIFSLVGNINNTGLVEVPMGIPLREIIFEIGGGIPGGKKLKAVQTGGPSGGCIPEQFLDMPVDFENLKEMGSIMGSGGMIVMDEDTCMVDVAKYFIEFCLDESCGQCTPCREGLSHMARLLKDITKGRGSEAHLEMLEELSNLLVDTSLCGLGKSAPNPVLSTLRYFRDEYMAHIRDKRCPAGVCKALLTFTIDPSKCTGCTVCSLNCSVGAISGEKKMAHHINQTLCIKCGMCFDGCKFKAIKKE